MGNQYYWESAEVVNSPKKFLLLISNRSVQFLHMACPGPHVELSYP